MIIGVGTDIISLDRIRYALSAFGNKFLQRILTRNERNYYIEMHNEDNKTAFLAKRFAAKEAISKALGVGIGESLSFQDIEISNNELGKPIVKIEKFADVTIHLSLSDEKEGLAIAFAIAER